MSDPITFAAFAGAALCGLAIAALAGLRAWAGWLDLKRLELSGHRGDRRAGPALDRIEIADLKERLRKLEAIASFVDP